MAATWGPGAAGESDALLDAWNWKTWTLAVPCNECGPLFAAP